MRLFIAINVSDETRGGLLALRDSIREKSELGIVLYNLYLFRIQV